MREDLVGRAQGVQDRPVVAVLDGVVRPVVAAPALDAQQLAALVEEQLERSETSSSLARSSSRSSSAHAGGGIGVVIRTAS